MDERKAHGWSFLILDKYKLRIPIISHIYIIDFQFNDIKFTRAKEKGEKSYFDFSFEAGTPQEIELQITKARDRIALLSDAIAFFHDKGVKFGNAMLMRAQRQISPDGKKVELYMGWGKEEVLANEEVLKNKIFPLYEKLKKSDSEIILCLTWFNAGLSEVNKINKFLAYWISLEAITPPGAEKEIDTISLEQFKKALKEVRKIKFKDNASKSVIIQKMTDAAKYKTIPAAMAERIQNIISKEECLKLLSILHMEDLRQTLSILSADRGKIAHGKQREVADLEKKTIFLHNLLYKALEKLLL